MNKIMDIALACGESIEKADRQLRHDRKGRDRQRFDSRQERAGDLPKAYRVKHRYQDDEVQAWKEGRVS